MRAGRIVEKGSPQKIYFNADHRFVADFIGRANQIEAVVEGNRDGRTLVRTGMGLIECRARELAEGSTATLCIRPEFIRVTSKDRGEGQNVIQGRVEALEFVGEVYEADISVGEERLLARIDPDIDMTQGDEVSISLDPAHCLLLLA
jgi:iron(III) transport system ATP-binding protein